MASASSTLPNTSIHLIPDWCNLGIMFRVILGINFLFIGFAWASAKNFAQWRSAFLDLALLVEPVLISSLLLSCLTNQFARRLLKQFSARIHIALAIVLPALLTLLLQLLLAPLLSNSTFELVRNSLLASLIAAVTIYWAHLRYQASPALAQAQIQALQARIRPHFLFNSLNAVLNLMRADPAHAETALEDLADLFRVLIRDHREQITLTEEIALCKQYLGIESLRLGERLKVVWQIDPNIGATLVPLLLLQPLIENAVHHGIEPLVEGGTIEIWLQNGTSHVDIRIVNPSQAHARPLSKGHSNHMALDNVRERIALLYDLEAEFNIVRSAPRFEVQIRLPKSA